MYRKQSSLFSVNKTKIRENTISRLIALGEYIIVKEGDMGNRTITIKMTKDDTTVECDGLQDIDMSRALVALTEHYASLVHETEKEISQAVLKWFSRGEANES